MSLLTIDPEFFPESFSLEAFSSHILQNVNISDLSFNNCDKLLSFMNQMLHAHAQLEFQQSFQTNFEAIQRLQALNNANSMQTGDFMQTDDQFAVQLLAQQNLLLAQQQNLGQGLNVQGMGQSLGMNQTIGQNMGMNQNIGQNMSQTMGQTMGQTMSQTMGQTNQGFNQNLNQQFDLNMASQSHIQSLNNNLTNSSMNLSQMDTGSNFYPQVGTPTHLLGRKPGTLAKKNFQKFQLEHGSFVNKRSEKPLSKATQKSHIRDAFKKLGEKELLMFEGEQSAEWKRFLIGKENSGDDRERM